MGSSEGYAGLMGLGRLYSPAMSAIGENGSMQCAREYTLGQTQKMRRLSDKSEIKIEHVFATYCDS